jgi:hypothetical protein
VAIIVVQTQYLSLWTCCKFDVPLSLLSDFIDVRTMFHCVFVNQIIRTMHKWDGLICIRTNVPIYSKIGNYN